MQAIATFFLLVACAVAFPTDLGETEADYSTLNIITRAQWGARPANGRVNPLRQNPAPYVVIHHANSTACTTQAICQARMRSFQNYHIDTKKWSDIGYNFVIGEDGNIYEGRGWGKAGAHSTNYNSKSVGICFIGDFNARVPNAAAIGAARKLINWAMNNNKITSTYKLVGHRQTATTRCPGNNLYNLIKTWPHWVAQP
ncbi:hypothetical protein KM043_016382 [Ampulex compressa]|nr:hypothetical protein KM043_016382 [Ampulex compressa]